LVSFGTRFAASDSKATKRPCAESAGNRLSLLPSTPFGPTLTRSIVAGVQADTLVAAAIRSAATMIVVRWLMLASRLYYRA
jgi:hypothetical protein